jgi:polysaccharide biosynthesis protein PslG
MLAAMTGEPTQSMKGRVRALAVAVAACAALTALAMPAPGAGDVRGTSAALQIVVRGGMPMATGAGCSTARRGGFVGVGGGDSFGNRVNAECILGLQAGSGVGFLRHAFDWTYIEPAPGRYDFSQEDWWVAATARKRIRLLPVLFGAPSFYVRRHAASTSPPSNRAAFGNYAAAVVRRYGPNGSFWAENPDVPKLPIRSWQVWNEPNLRQYWYPRPNPAAYVKLLKAAYKGIKGVDPHAEVLTAGLPDSKQGGAMRFTKFVTGMYRAGGKSAFDALAPNAYATTARGVIERIGRIRALMRKFGDRRAAIWVTEVGWGTGGPKNRFNIGSKRQATEIAKLLRGLYRARHKYKVRGVVYYGWQDKPPYAPKFKDMWGLHTGLFTLKGKPKPGYRAFARVAPGLR